MTHSPDPQGSPRKSIADRLDWITPTEVPARPPGSAQQTQVSPRSQPLVFTYKAKPAPVIGAILFFGLGGWFMNETAKTNQRGLIIEHLIHLSPEQATLFYHGIALLSLGFVLLALFVIPQLFIHRELVLEHDAAILPVGFFSKRQQRIPLDSIHDVRITTVRKKYTFVTIYHDAGKTKINGSMLPNAGDIDLVLRWLAERIRR